jgi:hypothetical protein
MAPLGPNQRMWGRVGSTSQFPFPHAVGNGGKRNWEPVPCHLLDVEVLLMPQRGGSRRRVGIACPAQAAGVLRLVLRKQPIQHSAAALIHEVDMGEIPAGVADLELGEMAVAIRHFKALTGNDEGAFALSLHCRGRAA